MLNGLIRPTSGVVIADGRDISRVSEQELTRPQAGGQTQSAALFDSLTVPKMVLLGERNSLAELPTES